MIDMLNQYAIDYTIYRYQCLSPPNGCGRDVVNDIRNWTEAERKEFVSSGWCDNCQWPFLLPVDDSLEFECIGNGVF